jgi:hypothetical protein
VAAATAAAEAARSAQAALETSLVDAEEDVGRLTAELKAERAALQRKEEALATEGARCAMIEGRAEASAEAEVGVCMCVEGCLQIKGRTNL